LIHFFHILCKVKSGRLKMPCSRFCFVIYSVALFLYFSTQPKESSAFGWTKNFGRKIRKNPSRFHLSSISTTNQNQMRQRPGLDVIRIAASRSSSVSIDDGDSDDSTKQSSTYSNLWRKDPRNRSVCGILICTCTIQKDRPIGSCDRHETFATHPSLKPIL
jgi:hypothetical protein